MTEKNQSMKNFKGKAIYNPSGKAAEYSKWAVNFYNGCSARCDYCYNRHGITAKVLGCDTPTIKKSLKDEDTALQIFIKEADQNRDALSEHGLFFNFVSDPFLKETIVLNAAAIQYCLLEDIPVKVLTKQTWWLEEFLHGWDKWIEENYFRYECKYFLAFGFTLTGHDELEPGAAPNMDRIRAMKVLHNEGFKTWASIEPIIDLGDSYRMIEQVKDHIGLAKIGLQSGKKYSNTDLLSFMAAVKILSRKYDFKVYFKDSFLKQAVVKREELKSIIGFENCVDRDYNMFEN